MSLDIFSNLLRGDKVLIFVPSDCYSGLLQPSDLSSLSAGRSIACHIRMSLYIFLLYYINHLCFTCIDCYDLFAWGGCWFVVYIMMFIYKFLNVCPFDYTAVAGSGKFGPVNQVNHTSWVAVVTPTDRPKSVRNRCVIKLFMTLFALSFCPFDNSADVGAFVIGLSQISSFFSYYSVKLLPWMSACFILWPLRFGWLLLYSL